jgi:hypothetical protein
MDEPGESGKRSSWWVIAASYGAACVLYVFSQPPLTVNPTPDQVLLGRLSSAFTFGIAVFVGIVAGSIGGLIYKARGRPFPWTNILWSTLTIVVILGVMLTFGAWYAHEHPSTR